MTAEAHVEEHSAPRARERWRAEAVGSAWAWAMRLQAMTWRRTVVGLERIDELEQQGARVMLVVWHGDYRPLLAAVREHPSVLLSTDSFRGRIIEAAARRLGHRCVLRPPDLHGEAAVDWLCSGLARARRIVVAADGPDGPERRVKRGVVTLAARLGLRSRRSPRRRPGAPASRRPSKPVGTKPARASAERLGEPGRGAPRPTACATTCREACSRARR
jgi:lysophospholipid acyltransferase (LPLAT)-like uncharacterized protein